MDFQATLIPKEDSSRERTKAKKSKRPKRFKADLPKVKEEFGDFKDMGDGADLPTEETLKDYSSGNDGHSNDEVDDGEVCVGCGEGPFSSSDLLQEHLSKTGHSGDCPICGPEVSFASWAEHQRHLESAHGGSVRRCRHCPEVLDSREALLRHVMLSHNPHSNRVECKICGELCTSRNLDRHMADKHGQKSATECKECNMKFKSPGLLNAHNNKKHNKFPCETCGKLVVYRDVKRHNMLFHSAEENKRFVCLLCNPIKGFIERYQYEEHMNIHNGEKPFACDKCENVRYASKANLNAHIRSTHRGIKRKAKGKVT